MRNLTTASAVTAWRPPRWRSLGGALVPMLAAALVSALVTAAVGAVLTSARQPPRRGRSSGGCPPPSRRRRSRSRRSPPHRRGRCPANAAVVACGRWRQGSLPACCSGYYSSSERAEPAEAVREARVARCCCGWPPPLWRRFLRPRRHKYDYRATGRLRVSRAYQSLSPIVIAQRETGRPATIQR